jgi:hypothetical protein
MAGYYAVSDVGEGKVSALIHPKVDPEIALVTKADLRVQWVRRADFLTIENSFCPTTFGPT